MKPEQIRESGARDYFAMSGKYSNPYAIGTAEHDAYERGWMQSLKRDGGKRVDAKGVPDFSQKGQSKAQNPVNLYALAKGRSGSR